MKKVTIGLLLLSQFSLFTQNFKFGKVSKEELQHLEGNHRNLALARVTIKAVPYTWRAI